MDYQNISETAKALSDPNRIKILEMLIPGELCACKILERFEITQPTLSHHMKILSSAGLVEAHRDGKWMHYTIRRENFEKFSKMLDLFSSED